MPVYLPACLLCVFMSVFLSLCELYHDCLSACLSLYAYPLTIHLPLYTYPPTCHSHTHTLIHTYTHIHSFTHTLIYPPTYAYRTRSCSQTVGPQERQGYTTLQAGCTLSKMALPDRSYRCVCMCAYMCVCVCMREIIECLLFSPSTIPLTPYI